MEPRLYIYPHTHIYIIKVVQRNCSWKRELCADNAGHAGIIQQLIHRGFYLTDFDDIDEVENLLMTSDKLHHVSIIGLNSVCVQ